MLNVIAVFIGGGLGAVLRYSITQLASKFFGVSQLGTFSANILGCFLIGFIFGFTINKTSLMPTQIKLFITVGFLGGLTTFSTFSNEAFCFFKDGKLLHGGMYILLSIVVGLCATAVGHLAGKQIV